MKTAFPDVITCTPAPIFRPLPAFWLSAPARVWPGFSAEVAHLTQDHAHRGGTWRTVGVFLVRPPAEPPPAVASTPIRNECPTTLLALFGLQ